MVFDYLRMLCSYAMPLMLFPFLLFLLHYSMPSYKHWRSPQNNLVKQGVESGWTQKWHLNQKCTLRFQKRDMKGKKITRLENGLKIRLFLAESKYIHTLYIETQNLRLHHQYYIMTIFQPCHSFSCRVSLGTREYFFVVSFCCQFSCL